MDLFGYKSATFSPCRKYRYVLTRIWDTDKPKVMFIGLNPSTANENTDDPTIRRVISFAKNLGYGGLYMLNLFAYVTSKPEVLFQCDDPIDSNDYYLRHYHLLSSKVIFCWGNFNVGERDKEIIKMFPKAYCLGKNSNGSPKHPLYLKADTIPVPFMDSPLVVAGKG